MGFTPSSPLDVAYVSYDGLLEPLGAAQVIPHVLGLADRGFSMGVLSFEKARDLRDEDRLSVLKDRLAAGNVRWHPLRYHRRPTLPATAFDVARAAAFLRRLAPALVHARSYVAATMAALGASKERAKLLFDTRGRWIDERIEGQGWNPSSFRVLRGRRIEANLLARADHVVHLTEAARRHAEAAGARAPSTTIPTCVDLERFRVPVDVGAVRRDLGLPEDGPILLHAGTLSGRYQLERTLAVAGAFVARTGGVFLVVSREGDQIADAARAAGVPMMVREADHDDMHRWVGAADAGLALIRTGQSTVASAPTKVGEYLSAGLAVTATAVGDLPEHLGGCRYSRVVAHDEPPDETAARLAKAALGGRARQAESRAVAERHYALDRALELYAGIYRELGVAPCS